MSKKMSRMKIIISTLFVFVAGIAFGFGIAVFFGYIISVIDPGTDLTHHTKVFGDIKIRAVKTKDPNISGHQFLAMTKDNIQFFYAEVDEFDKVQNIAILGEDKHIRFAMSPSNKPGTWQKAYYTYDDTIHSIGTQYVDLDFDGRFDVKLVFDNEKREKSGYIWFNQTWTDVDEYSGEYLTARYETQEYVFKPESGSWIQEK